MRARIYRFSDLLGNALDLERIKTECHWPDDAVVTFAGGDRIKAFIVLSETYDDIPLPELMNHVGWVTHNYAAEK